ncbi:MAG: CBS domain-containing protein [Metallibacterium scheffleri]|jgi:CBS domain-containing protein|uniref:CBS domain-containing protein n=1 Tax=Metallibacterium scheffleri TaxID=993689 RepID=UPI0026EBD2EA|nr:CBS domain-containing protein [Metallibacterium scheffleri]MCK9366756.1 CBS domain-containing protein [Metallibacterium scheffleri]
MRQVKHLLESKGSSVHAIAPEQSVLSALQRMAELRIGALLVMRGAELLGVVSERDYARKVALQGRASSDTPVREIMSAPALTVSPEESVEACMRLCTDSRVRHLPVVERGAVVGVISIGDLVKAVIDDQAVEIEHLQRYIAG